MRIQRRKFFSLFYSISKRANFFLLFSFFFIISRRKIFMYDLSMYGSEEKSAMCVRERERGECIKNIPHLRWKWGKGKMWRSVGCGWERKKHIRGEFYDCMENGKNLAASWDDSKEKFCHKRKCENFKSNFSLGEKW